MFYFHFLFVSYTVLGKKVTGVFCSQNPCVFFSSVYVVLNVVVLILGVFVPV